MSIFGKIQILASQKMKIADINPNEHDFDILV